MPRPSAFTLCLLLSCGSSDPKRLTDAGSAALNSGDAKGAVADFDRALEHMDASHPDYLRACVTRCQALARIDPTRAKDDFLALARSPSARVRDSDFVAVSTELFRRNAISSAIEIAEVGMKSFPESPAMKTLRDTFGDAAKKANDPAALERLKGLGYAGDG
jgi:hypothetical protein